MAGGGAGFDMQTGQPAAQVPMGTQGAGGMQSMFPGMYQAVPAQPGMPQWPAGNPVAQNQQGRMAQPSAGWDAQAYMGMAAQAK
eukprot:scaffold548265_cov55-Attheya_sp.AAC.1